jgi:hypothetical protein
MKKQDALRQPFFASLLESQGKTSTGEQFYPTPTDPIRDQAQTQKYPSDNEDNPGGPKDPGIL